MIGVSPAYYISKYSSNFTITNYIDSLEWLSDNNFTSTQLEIFHYEQIDQWTFTNCKKLYASLNLFNIKVSQFVAHFLMTCFDSLESLKKRCGIDELEFIAVIINNFSFTDTITIPVPPFKGDLNNKEAKMLFDQKLEFIEEVGGKYNLKMALEPQPGSLAADLSFLNRFKEIGLNLDPGHLLCSGIDPFSLGQDVLSRVKATHLCENDAVKNLSLSPGTLNYNWEILISNLYESGYTGSLDIEIICEQSDIESLYKNAHFFLSKYCIQNNIYIKKGDKDE